MASRTITLSDSPRCLARCVRAFLISGVTRALMSESLLAISSGGPLLGPTAVDEFT